MDQSSATTGSAEDAEPPAAGEAETPSQMANPTPILSSESPSSWQRELLAAHTSSTSLAGAFGGEEERLAYFDEVGARYPVRIPPYYLSLMDTNDPDDPIARMAMPDVRELSPCPSLTRDPLHEEEHMPVERLIHRYRDRALIIATTTCAMYCRFCTRKRLAGRAGGRISNKHLDGVLGYLRAHPEIRDVIVSGGDPLTLGDAQLAHILAAVRSVPSVEILRIGTRIPAVLPMRVTNALARMLARFQPLFVNTHFNHPRELTPQAVAACGRLIDAGIPVGNQSVLLAGVNDRPEVMAELLRKLIRARVRPYYLFQCDLTEGVEHLRTPISKGIEIMESLRGRVSGLAIPTYVVDGPHGLGKVPIIPNYIISQAPGRTALRNAEGHIAVYPDPVPGVARQDGGGMIQDGVSGLLGGALDTLGADSSVTAAHSSSAVPTQASNPKRGVRVGLAFNVKRTDCLVDDREAEFDSPRTIKALDDAIRSLGYEVVQLEADSSFPARASEAKVDVVFNIAEGFNGRCREAHVPAVCEMLGIEYTGSDPLTLAASLDKSITKRLLREAGIPTPPFFLVNGSPTKVPSGISFPVIVKPNAEGSSKGVGLKSVANNTEELARIVSSLRKRYGRIPMIVECFVYGREVTVGLLPNKAGKLAALPPMEVVFLRDDGLNVYGYDLKQNWDGHLTYQCPARMDEKQLKACRTVATQAARALGCRDIARVDLRLDPQGTPWVIELNPLPGLTPSYSDMVMIAEATGLEYRGLVGRILDAAVARANARKKRD